jgi:PAS domain S-box-containing protein
MDWSSVAGLLAERADRPLMLIDGTGKLCLVNGAMERILGHSRREIEGQPWTALGRSKSDAPGESWVDRGLRGAVEKCECEIRTRDGHRVKLGLEMSPIGRGRSRGLLVTVLGVSRLDETLARSSGADMDYVITATPGHFGTLVEVTGLGGSLADDGPKQCFRRFHRQSSPCDDCPVLKDAQTPWPRTAVRGLGKGSAEPLQVLTAEPEDAGRVRVRVRAIENRTLTAIHEAKIAALADEANLSDRERAVLKYLLMGRSLEDIALILDISPRTVKHHQSNVVRKLGADSRHDLVRLAGF